MIDRPSSYLVQTVGLPEPATGIAEWGGEHFLVPFGVRIIYSDKATGEPHITVTARIDERDGRPVLLSASFTSPDGWHLPSWQREWSWSGLLRHSLAVWTDLEHRQAVADYLAQHGRRHDLTDPFLASVAAEYLAAGPKYAPELAQQHAVSRATIRRWIDLARQRDLLTRPERRNATGGRLTAAGTRALRRWRTQQRRDEQP